MQKLTVFIDNQAAIQSIERPRNQSRQMILGMIRRNINLLQARGIKVTLRWIPAHTGVKGNEEVDLMAKMATGWTLKKGNRQQAVRSTLPWILQLLLAYKRQINQGIKA